jgi:hypothetical protein
VLEKKCVCQKKARVKKTVCKKNIECQKKTRVSEKKVRQKNESVKKCGVPEKKCVCECAKYLGGKTFVVQVGNQHLNCFN